MAHVALLHDADRAHRDRFAAGVRNFFAELPGMTTSEVRAGPLTILWAAAPHAPVDLHREGDRVALLVGYAVHDAGRWINAKELADDWLGDNGQAYVYDGYHVGVAFDPARGLAAGVDPLGLFPLYHASLASGGLMVATTPGAFISHPDFVGRIDRPGLAGILLAHGLLDDRPLMAGARRLPMGHRLVAFPGRAAEEREVFRIDAVPPAPSETCEQSCERLEAELITALRRHRPPSDDTLLMLSGGLDSRLVAGCLADLGIPTRGVTFGRPGDHEVRAARAVAERLGMPLEVISTETSNAGFTARSRLAVRQNHLSSGPGGDDFAVGLASAATQARFHWSGVPFDWVFEPVSKHSGYDIATGTWSFDRMLTHTNAWGVPVDRLPALLGGDGRELCRELLGSLEAFCTGGPLPPERQSSVLRWDQRVRNHLAAAIHQTTAVAWPLMPATDRRFFQTAFGIPLSWSADRGIEKAILMSRRPDLAEIPFDTNSFTFEPLLVGPKQPGLASAGRSLFQRLRRATQAFLPAADPRRYERLFNVDEPRWRSLRREVEPLRPKLEEHLDGPTLATILPPPDRLLRSRKPLMDGSPIRLLCGLAMLLEERSFSYPGGRS